MKSQAEWENWLEQHGLVSSGVWLRLARKGAEHPTVSYAEAVESALCFGWIDGQKRAEDPHYWLQRFTPRTPKSIWSKINKAKAEALIAAGRIRVAGLQEIERAKRDGRWSVAYASASTATVPQDFQQALDANRKAKEFFCNAQQSESFCDPVSNSGGQTAGDSCQEDCPVCRNAQQGRKASSVRDGQCLTIHSSQRCF